jgi:peroxisomal membrane protein 4
MEDKVSNINSILNIFESDYCKHEHANCLISALKGLRNGIYYGGKVRFIHSLVMTILFSKESSLKQKIIKSILRPTIEHSFNLGMFAFLYKLTVCILRRVFKSTGKIINFISGLLSSYFFWTKSSNVNIQIMLYLLSRNLQIICTLITDKFFPNFNYGYELTSMVSWAIGLYFTPKYFQNSLKASHDFIYKSSDKTNGWRDFFPVYIP